MNNLPVALQTYTVRDVAEGDFAGVMKQVKAIGYDYIEIGGLYRLTPKEYKEILDANGLRAISAHVGIHEMINDTEGIASNYKFLGVDYLAIPYMPDELRPGRPGFDKIAEEIKRVGAIFKTYGITLIYHNHDFEFEKLPDGRYVLDALYEAIPADALETQIDTCWCLVSGVDPAAYIRKYAGRCPVVHLKDFFKEGEAADMYELMGQEETKGVKPKGIFEFRAVGHGVQNFPPILAASLESGAKWVVVEQDTPIAGCTSIEDAKKSRDYLKSLGW